MTPKEIANLLYDESIRVEQIIWLAANHDQPCDAFRALVEDEDPARLAKLLGIDREFFAEDCELSDLGNTLARKGLSGFLVQVSTPIPLAFHRDGFTTGGFGYTTLEWLYTEAIDDAFIKRMTEWKDAFIKRARAKAQKTAKAR
jgi:hypothetical protein